MRCLENAAYNTAKVINCKKVSTVLDVLNDKTVSAYQKMVDEALLNLFIDFFLRTWDILNWKNPSLHNFLNDPHWKQFNSTSDERFYF